MAFKVTCRLNELTLRVQSCQTAFRTLCCSGFTVKHDRHNRRFTVSPGSGAGTHESAVLSYSFTGEKEVHLTSTFVPESFRGQGVAALLSQAAMDFVVEENLKARVSCWYIQKYVEDHPERNYKDLIIA